MPVIPPRQLFVNLPVRDLKRSVEFFTQLGFAFDPRFTDDSATCMILSDAAFVMLLERQRFAEFTKNQLCNTTTHTEALFALSCATRSDVDAMVESAVSAGGAHAMAQQDLGFMYQSSFYDLDGHHWEAFWMDAAAAPPAG
jgi:predicted lactoylglutathione lyase